MNGDERYLCEIPVLDMGQGDHRRQVFADELMRTPIQLLRLSLTFTIGFIIGLLSSGELSHVPKSNQARIAPDVCDLRPERIGENVLITEDCDGSYKFEWSYRGD